MSESKNMSEFEKLWSMLNTRPAESKTPSINYGGPYSGERYEQANQVLNTGNMGGAPSTGNAWSNKWFGGKDNVGILTGGAQALSGLASAWGGLESVKLGKKNLNFQKQAYNTNLANQTQLLNQSLEDKYRRVQSAVGNEQAQSKYGTLEQYMNQNRVNSKPV